MPPLYVMEQGSKLSVDHQQVLIRKNGELLDRVPIAHTDAVLIYGNVAVTTPAIKRLMWAGVDLVFLTVRGHYVGRMVGPLTKFGELRASQYRHAADPVFALSLSQTIVQAKLLNMRAFLLRRARATGDEVVGQAAAHLSRMAADVPALSTHETLLGVEGSGSAAYFGVFGRLLGAGWQFRKRTRRPPADPVNVLLSLGYTILARLAEGAVSSTGLDPYLGVLHQPAYGRPSLALDLVEEFRTPIVDMAVLRCLNEGMIAAGDFTHGGPGERPLVLSTGGMKSFIRALEARLETTVTHPRTGEQITYRRAVEVQARALARCFRDGTPGYQPFRLR